MTLPFPGPAFAAMAAGVSGGGAPSEPERTGYDYLITNDADWTTVFANSDAVLSGKIIQILSTASLSAKTLSGRVMTTQTTIRGGKTSVKPQMGKLLIGTCQKITFQDIDFYQPANNDSCIGATATNVAIKFNACKIHSGNVFDPLGDYTLANPGTTANQACGNGGGADWNDVEFNDCEVYDLFNGLIISAKGPGGATINGCYFHNIYGDSYQLNANVTTPPSFLKDTWNRSWLIVCRATDLGNPHGDHRQTQNGSAGTTLISEGNIFILPPTLARGLPQGMFVENPTASGRHKGRMAYNFILLPDGGGNGFVIGNSQEMFVHSNFIGRHDPGNGTGIVGFVANNNGGADVLIQDNRSETFTISGAIRSVNNIPHGNVFANYDALNCDNVQDFTAAVAAAQGLWPNVDFTNRTIDRTNEHPGVVFSPMFDQVSGGVSTSLGSKIKAGPATMAFSTSAGMEAQYADDAAFTVNASAWLTSGNVATDKYIRVRHTNGVGNSISTETTLTLNGKAITFDTTTAATPWQRVSFNTGATTGDRLARTAIIGAGSDKYTLAMVFGPHSRPTGTDQQILRHFSGPNYKSMSVGHRITSGAISIIGRNSAGTIVHNWQFTPSWTENGNDHTLLISVDHSQATFQDGVKIWFDGVEITNATNNIGWVQGAVLDFGAASSTWTLGYGNGASPGSSDYHCNFSLVYLNIGEALDLSSATNRNKFTRDFIGADGSGPTGTVPEICFYGDAATYAGGTINKGNGGAFTLTGTVDDI